MRLTCPNCGAQYEVPDEVIPEEGRDVQCSNCEQTWFQAKHPETADAPAAPEPAAPAPEASQPAEKATDAKPAEKADEKPATEPEAASKPTEEAATGNVDPAVANILKQEAEREAELRAQEGGSLETQTDLGLDSPPEPEKPAPEPTATQTAKDSGQKDALPDVEAINSSLRSDEPTPGAEEDQPLPRKSGGGFLRGFLLILIIGVILFLIYGNAQKISEAVPQADPVLNSYVSMVDQARLWLETQAGSGTSQN